MHENTQDQQPNFAEKAAQLKALVEELTKDAPALARHVADQAKDGACRATKQAVDIVRRHPVETAAVAIGAGLLAWWLMTRRGSQAA